MITWEIEPYYVCELEDSEFRVRSYSKLKKGGYLKHHLSGSGYFFFRLGSQTVYTHQIIAKYFHGPCPEGLEINHIDGDKLNNNPGNLKYVTHLDNVRHAHETGLAPSGEKHQSYKHGLYVGRNIETTEGIREIHREYQRKYREKKRKEKELALDL